MKLNLILLLIFLLFFLIIGESLHSTKSVVLEFFYIDTSGCTKCYADIAPEINRVERIINEIRSKYGDFVDVKWLDITGEGSKQFNQYNLTKIPSIVINGKDALSSQDITKESLENIINPYLGLPASTNFSTLLCLGLLSFLSPCLIIMLAFILAYTISTRNSLKNWVINALIFSIGLITAEIFLGVALYLRVSTVDVDTSLRYFIRISSVILIFGGLNLLGFFKLPSNNKFLIKLSALKRGLSFAGLFFLGFLFYLVEVHVAPSFVFVPSSAMLGTIIDLSYFLAFSIGILTPLIGIGIVSIETPKLAKQISPQYYLKIREISGIILIAYDAWLILEFLMTQL